MSDLLFKQDQLILFIGDSITDAGRCQVEYQPLGFGYVMIAAGMIEARYPHLELQFENRGIGGNTVLDLQGRWQEDAIDLQPDWLSCLIGVNDATRAWRHGQLYRKLTPEHFRSNYRQLLQQVRGETPARLILWEPFLATNDRRAARYTLQQEYVRITNELAEEFDALLIKTQGLFDGACEKRSSEYWAPDAVHPTLPGRALMAEALLDAVGW
jgi:acyl-CoA thioesterase-1